MADRPTPCTYSSITTTSRRRRRRRRLGAVASAAAATVATSIAVLSSKLGSRSPAHSWFAAAFVTPRPIAIPPTVWTHPQRYSRGTRRSATVNRSRTPSELSPQSGCSRATTPTGAEGEGQPGRTSYIKLGRVLSQRRGDRELHMNHGGTDEGQGLASMGGATTIEDVGKMKLPELKALYRERGGKPGTLRKSELVDKITALFMLGEQDAGDFARSVSGEDVSSVSTSVLKSPTARVDSTAVLSPLETGSKVVGEMATAPIPASVGHMMITNENERAVVGQRIRDNVPTSESLNGFTRNIAVDPLRGVRDEPSSASSVSRRNGAVAQTPTAEARTTSVGGSAGSLSPDDHLHRVANQLLQERHDTTLASASSLEENEGAGRLNSPSLAQPPLQNGADSNNTRVTSGETPTSSKLREGAFFGGPAAVAAAARARGAAAAAASARVAASGRSAALSEAKRHADAVRARASSAWRQSADAQRSQQVLHQSTTQVLVRGDEEESVGAKALQRKQGVLAEGRPMEREWSKPLVGADLIEDAVREGTGRLDRLRNRGAGSAGGGRQSDSSGTATRTFAATDGDDGHVDGRGKRVRLERAGRGGGGADTALPYRRTEQPVSSARPPDAASSEQGGAGDIGETRPVEPSIAGGAGRDAGNMGARAGTGAGAGVGEGAAGLGVRGRTSGRPRRMPKIHNPWAQAANPAAEKWISGDGNVVDEFLMHTMGKADEQVDPPDDPVFNRSKRFESTPDSPMRLQFLGTASCIPSVSRGVSCTVLRMQGDLWMFDAGEGTQIQIQRSTMKPTRVTKIFITHAHGDHSFGLPGMLCLMGQHYERTQGKHIEIYGPTGLRAYLRAAMRYTYSRVAVPYVVHELRDVPHLHGDYVPEQEEFYLHLNQDSRFGEQRGGRDIYPNEKGVYELINDDKAIVRATPMKHGVPCVGYCIEEPAKPGRLRAKTINPIVMKHKDAIVKATGNQSVGWVLGAIKALKPGESMTLPGTDVNIDFDYALEPSSRGRKVVILGDTCDAGTMVPLAEDADVVVHEATNTFLYPIDQGKTYATVENEAIDHGHSTPLMAAAFARRVKAKMLVLNHFSARYRGDSNLASVASMMRIERQATRASGLDRHQVVAAWDLLDLPVLSSDTAEAYKAKAKEEDSSYAAHLSARATEWRRQEYLTEVEGRGQGDEGPIEAAMTSSYEPLMETVSNKDPLNYPGEFNKDPIVTETDTAGSSNHSTSLDNNDQALTETDTVLLRDADLLAEDRGEASVGGATKDVANEDLVSSSSQTTASVEAVAKERPSSSILERPTTPDSSVELVNRGRGDGQGGDRGWVGTRRPGIREGSATSGDSNIAGGVGGGSIGLRDRSSLVLSAEGKKS